MTHEEILRELRALGYSRDRAERQLDDLRIKGFGGVFAAWERERNAEFDRVLAETAAKLKAKA